MKFLLIYIALAGLVILAYIKPSAVPSADLIKVKNVMRDS
jgi:hypothetical protein